MKQATKSKIIPFMARSSQQIAPRTVHNRRLCVKKYGCLSSGQEEVDGCCVGMKLFIFGANLIQIKLRN